MRSIRTGMYRMYKQVGPAVGGSSCFLRSFQLTSQSVMVVRAARKIRGEIKVSIIHSDFSYQTAALLRPIPKEQFSVGGKVEKMPNVHNFL